MHFWLDGTWRTNSIRLAKGVASGWLALGPVTNGTHLLQLQAEGFLGDCDVGTLTWWAGSLQVVTSSLATNVAGGEFTHTAGPATGLAVGDYNGDGYADVFETFQDRSGVLLLNNRAGGLNRTNLPPSSGPATGQTATWADYDNDGWLDLLVATPDRGAAGGNLLYRNLGGTNFLLLAATNMPSAESNSVGCAWADMDNDGWVDFAIASSSGSWIELYRNNGDGMFTHWDNSSNLLSGAVRAIAFGDLNNDGYPDLVSAGPGGVHLFRNFTNHFEEIIGSQLANDSTAQSVSWADCNCDGWPDLFITSSDHLGALYTNNQDWTFTQVQIPTFNVPGFVAAACAWGDFDQDGRLDLFVSSGSTNYPSRLFHNNPSGIFDVITNGPVAAPPGVYVGSAWADVDRNGTPDLLVASQGGTNLLCQNLGSGANWLRVKLSGRPSNRAAIGARVEVLANIDGVSFWQLQEVSGGNGYASQNELPLTFGLGDATNVDSVRIEWPSGLASVFTNRAPNQVLTVSELLEGTPVVSVNRIFQASGEYFFVALDPVTVTIDSPYENGWVFYTTDDSDPDFTANWYTGPFEITPPATIRAIAYDEALTSLAIGDPAKLILVPTFFLTNSTPGGGDFTLSPPGPNYLSNTMVTLTATNEPGWTFTGWAGDLSGTNPTSTITMDGNKNIAAVFGTPLSTTVLGGTGYGSVSVDPAMALYPYGSVPRLSAIPAFGKYFVSWGLAGTNIATLTNNPMEWAMTTAAPSFIARLANLPTNTFSLTTLIEGQGSITRSPPGNFYTNGTMVTLTAVPANGQFFLGWSGDVTSTLANLTVVMDSSKVVTASFGLLPPLFSFEAAAYSVNEAAGSLALTVVHQGIAGQVSYATLDGTAVGGSGNTGDYTVTSGTLLFTNGEPSKTINIGLRDNFLVGPDKTFVVQLSNPTGGSGSLGNPAEATVTIHYNDPLTSSNSLLVQAFPGPVPDRSGSLRVTIAPPLPPTAGGFWRFPWEFAWRNSGELVTNLVQDEYPIEFRQIAGYSIEDVLPEAGLVFSNAPPTEVTNQYFAIGPGGVGSLTVQIGPNNPVVITNAGWRILGETAWRAPGSTAANQAPGIQIVEFKPVLGLAPPAAREVILVANQESLITAYYELPGSLPPNAALPNPLPSLSFINSSLSNTPRLPYAFNGQLRSDVGYSSGAAVCSNVVLTAAHVVFNDTTLSYVSQVSWFFQEQAGEFDPKPLTARGWYVLSSYASARTNDLTVLTNLYSPGVSSAESRSWDVAAVYFQSAAARGGFGGYLASDAPTNEWLTSAQPKLLVGYPMDGLSFGDTNIAPSKMHTNAVGNYSFTLQTNQVYASPDFVGLPGNSGGPLYVLCTNNIYYPAAVYLGSLGSASVVRAIDSNVVSLITLAATLGDDGTNHTGGGVITITPGGPSGTSKGFLHVNLGPADAISAGAGVSVNGGGYVTFVHTGYSAASVTLSFKVIPGWEEPATTVVTLTPGQTTVVTATYVPIPPAQLSLTPAVGLAAAGFAGGPFAPPSITYALSNAGGADLNWSATKSAPWLSLSSTGGTLVGGSSTNITVSINSSANSLAAGNYSDMVGFTNLSGGLGNTSRTVGLAVSDHPSVRITAPRLLNNGQFILTLQGVTGGVYSIVTSTNLLTPLSNWTEALKVTNTAGQTVFTNPLPLPAPQHYYRAREL